MNAASATPATTSKRRPQHVVIAAILLWFGLWTLTPGLLPHGWWNACRLYDAGR
ncbi:hypothetical protein ACTMTI_56665 [Nonomuraea sp. H19]|uniref:hypothetical protein n=1 Tax=Nonomuraea sp. H19 TaxID=3452206 RepID=UPI003F8A569C